jgi:5-oxoprolinase (ATP-hydrolysing) subunit C
VTAVVEVTAPGALATIQDLGRTGWRRFGVPCAGALDTCWLRIANRLAGNPEGAAAIEFFVAGPILKAHDAPVRLAFAGDFPITLERGGRAEIERSVLESWRSVTLQPGDTVRVGSPRSGRVGYVAIAGLTVPDVLGSASTYTRARIGGVQGRALAPGDRLHAAAAPSAASGEPAPEAMLREPPAGFDAPIRVIPGPQDDHFGAEAMATFFGADYRVSRDADRMGLRLEGPALKHRPDKGAEIVSDATVPGSIQVPGNGLPIVLLADGQTAGGYPKIATAISADLARLANAAVGAHLRFAPVSVAQAEALARAREEKVQRCLAAIEPLTLMNGVDLAALYANNLVGAMIDALRPPD